MEDPFETRHYDADGELIRTLPKQHVDDPAEDTADFDELCNGGDFLAPLTDDEILELENNGITVTVYENYTELLIPEEEGYAPSRVVWNDTYMETWETITTDGYDLAVYEKLQQSENGHLLLIESIEVQRLSLYTDHCIERHRTTQRENYILEGACGTTVMESSTLNSQLKPAGQVNGQVTKVYPTLLEENMPITITGLSTNADTEIQVINIFGQEVYREKPNRKAINIPTHELTPGVYFVKVRTGNYLTITQIQKY